ncbi:MAG: YceI family protein [Elusimicrobia bacterium]|nr:YceI family protein [Elusimicrobiota bacterium]
MRRRTLFCWVTFAVFLAVGSRLNAEQYQIDPVHSDVGFKIRHMMISKVSGRFDKFSGEFNFDEKDSKSWTAQAAIEASSINTANEKRDAHLRAADFFDVEKFPQMTFKSTKVTDFSAGKAKLHGLLTLHGVEKPVILDLEIGGVIQDPMGGQRSGFEATTRINRKDFGLVYNKVLEAGGLAIGEEVEITIHIEGISQKGKTEDKAPKPVPTPSK